MHALEALFPVAYLSLNRLPFLFANFGHHVTVNDKFFVNLIDLSVNYSVGNSFNGPFFNVTFRNLNIKRAIFIRG